MQDIMKNPNAFSCALIGEDTLLSQCGEILLAGGHSIELVITNSESISRWADGHSLVVVPANRSYLDALKTTEYDYLFAITHLAIIPDNALETAKIGTINFHDGPLPEYAGLNTPMWALIQGAEHYSVTWHVMAPGIDTGDILLSEAVAIASDDTAVSLNTKCFAAALSSFPILVKKIEDRSLQPVPQDLSCRKYFGREDGPSELGLLDFNAPAQRLERLVRALNTGRYENTLGSAKILVNGTPYIVASANVIQGLPTLPAGEVTQAANSRLQVVCGNDAIEITSLANLAGDEVKIEILGLEVGENLLQDPIYKQDLNEISKDCASKQTLWINRLKQAEAINLPYRDAAAKSSIGDTSQKIDISFPNEFAANSLETLAGIFALFLSRVCGVETISIPVAGGYLNAQASKYRPLLADFGVVSLQVDHTMSAKEEVERIGLAIAETLSLSPWLRDMPTRQPQLRDSGTYLQTSPMPLVIAAGKDILEPSAEFTFRIFDSSAAQFEYMTGVFPESRIRAFAKQFQNWLAEYSAKKNEPAFHLDLLDASERERFVDQLNETEVPYDVAALMHSGFEEYALKNPDTVAVIAGNRQLTYGELNQKAEDLADHLKSIGVKPGTLVGVYISRSVELMIATIGVLKSGAAYVPLDPSFPADRIAFMIEDSAMSVVVSQHSLRASLPKNDARIVDVETFEIDEAQASISDNDNIAPHASPTDLAYVIYTSGSTGQPKGVMLEHRNVVNFYVAMDTAVPGAVEENRTWLAVTSLSFDISVLELFWTLNRGFKVVIYDEASVRSTDDTASESPNRVLDMGLFMWGNDDASGPDKYKLLIEGAKYFDEHGFSAVWTPERHFHAFGGPYPNPAVTGAAIATITKNIKIRAGSCVVPLHHSVRIAEEWSVVDNLSNGRVELAAASGWNPTDFVLRPENHPDNKRRMFEQLEEVRALWRGEKLTFEGPLGPAEVESLPRPVQAELPCWITTAGNPDTWADAGKLGLNILTHLLGQTLEEVADKTKMYREARQQAGFDPKGGKVALMLHTFVGDDNSRVKEIVRDPMKDYLSSSMKLAMDYAWSFPAFKRPGGDVSKPEDIDLKSLSEQEVDIILDFAFERYFEASGLFGDEDTCVKMLAKCCHAGVDEIACLMDFGVDTQLILDSLPSLSSVRENMVASAARSNTSPVSTSLSFAELLTEHKITHLQCTPSTARMYLTDSDSRAAFSHVDHLMLGGEALPLILAQEIKQIHKGSLTNMYGPTETTIWSMTSNIETLEQGISIGSPIANTQIYILDSYLKPVPPGIPGELYIAGDGVARGYLNRAELTSERFVNNPFSNQPESRMYATGDLATFRDDGTVDYVGRTDFQVKVRGYRIELGEIEKRLEAVDIIHEAAVIVRSESDGDQRMVAYFTTHDGPPIDQNTIRELLRNDLPEYMVPNEFLSLGQMPRTANGKLDRNALAQIKPVVTRQISEDSAPKSDLEKVIADQWKKVLKLEVVGSTENFFDLGGHSLLVVQLLNLLKDAVNQPIGLTDLYQYTTIKSLAEFLTQGADDRIVNKGVSRGEQRRALRRRKAS